MTHQEELDFENHTNHPQKPVGNKQNAKIIGHLNSGRSLTSIEALNLYGCFRLAARIHDLRGKGFEIDCDEVETKSGKRIASYRIKNAQHIAT